MEKFTLVVVESPYAPATAPPPPEVACCCKCCEFDIPQNADALCIGHACVACAVWNRHFRELDRNVGYARAAMKDCLERDEAPYASHLLYTQPDVLDDKIPHEREQGIQAGFAWRQVAAKTVVYMDLGVSKGMQYGIDDAVKRKCPIEYRTIPGWSGQ